MGREAQRIRAVHVTRTAGTRATHRAARTSEHGPPLSGRPGGSLAGAGYPDGWVVNGIGDRTATWRRERLDGAGAGGYSQSSIITVTSSPG